MSAALLLSLFAASGVRAERVREPQIHARSEWHAEPVSDISEDMPKTRIVIHHTAAFVSDADKSLRGAASWRAAIEHARKAQYFHKYMRGWKDIGYHYMIDWDGRILEGRPVELLGAHVAKHNTGSVGVVLMGNLSVQRPTAKQIASLRALLNWLMSKFEISPKDISGHFQMKYTTCPGTYLNNVWDPDAIPIDFVQMKPTEKRRKRPRKW